MSAHWRIEEVPAIMQILEPVASGCGFLISVYGSTVRRGTGRDLDIICVQKRSNVYPPILLDKLAIALGGKIEIAEPSIFAEMCGLIGLPDGRFVDVQIRLSRCGPQDAMEFYERAWSVVP